MPGEFANPDLTLRGVEDLHSGASRLRDFPNVMYRLETGGISFLHLGDNRADWPWEVARSIGDIDVLWVTVDDSNHLLSYEEVDSLIQRLEPRVVIPMHYQIPGLMSARPDGNLRRVGWPPSPRPGALRATPPCSPPRACRPRPRSGSSGHRRILRQPGGKAAVTGIRPAVPYFPDEPFCADTNRRPITGRKTPA